MSVNLEDGESPCVKEWLYHKIFNEEHNFEFRYPRSNKCACDMLKFAGDNAKMEEEWSEIQQELACYHEKASKGCSSLLSDSKVIQLKSL